MAAAERGSEHPLALALLDMAARQRGLEQRSPLGVPCGSRASASSATVAGRVVLVGNRALMETHALEFARSGAPVGERQADTSATVVYAAVDGQPAGSIEVSDAIKTGAAEAVRELMALGVAVHLLSGDSTAAAREVARRVGIDRGHG